MITHRPLVASDLPTLQKALDQDEYEHLETKNYTRDGAFSEVYEDDSGPIGVLRYTKTLRLVTVWVDNDDKRRNAASVVQAIADAVQRARENGFSEIIFQTESPTLAQFCTKHLGFTESKGEYVLQV